MGSRTFVHRALVVAAFLVMTSFAYVVPSAALAGSGELGGLSPSDLRSAYDYTPVESSNQTVAVILAKDSPQAETDLGVYRTKYGIPTCTTANGCFRKVNQTGGTGYPTSNSESAREAAIDLEMVSAMCPSCHLLLVEANSNSKADLSAAVNEAALLGATVISDSWASTEVSSDTAFQPYYLHPGVPVFVGAGDAGYRNYLTGGSAPSFAGDLPEAISVGATNLTKASNARGWTETVWPGSGGGCSGVFAKPSWQTDTGCAKRLDNDVAAVGSDETPVSFYNGWVGAGWELGQGTSVSAPVVAGIFAQATPYTRSLGVEAFYKSGFKRFDVTSGTNYSSGCTPTYLCNATTGYDGPTGNGAPDGIPHIAPAAEGSWGVVGSQRPADANTPSQLYSTSCTAATTCTGTGAYVNTSQGYWGAMADSWAGGAWTSQGVIVNPGKKNGGLNGVSCTSATSCIGVGHYGSATDVGMSLAESKSGSTWTLMSSANPTGSTATELFGVSCVSSTSCTAVGHYFNAKWGAMGEEWNGSSWSILPVVVNPGDKNGSLRSVSCRSSTWCMAVGAYGSGGSGNLLAEERNGATWSVRSVPLSGVGKANQLNGVSCTSTTFCMAVGFYSASVLEKTEEFEYSIEVPAPVVARWNGTSWSVEKFPGPETNEPSEFSGVSCVSSTQCYVVGHHVVEGQQRAWIEYWNGSTWSSRSLPRQIASVGSTLNSVSCTSATSCAAVGSYGDPFGKEVPLTLGLFNS